MWSEILGLFLQQDKSESGTSGTEHAHSRKKKKNTVKQGEQGYM